MVGDNLRNDEPLEIMGGTNRVFVFGAGFLVGFISGIGIALMIF